jgi:DNA-binding transcriptional MerR regulator
MPWRQSNFALPPWPKEMSCALPFAALNYGKNKNRPSVVKDQKIKKLYYSISEVSRLTSLKAYVLRYWETEFAELKPKKNRAGNRIYNLDDIKLIFLIKRLLYEDKYTIAGARQRLRQLRRVGEQINLSFDQLRRDDCISELKKELQELLGMLNHNANEKNSNKS